jgi:hypothetical protein
MTDRTTVHPFSRPLRVTGYYAGPFTTYTKAEQALNALCAEGEISFMFADIEARKVGHAPTRYFVVAPISHEA